MEPEGEDSLAEDGATEVEAEDEVVVAEVEDEAEAKAWAGRPPSPPRVPLI